MSTRMIDPMAMLKALSGGGGGNPLAALDKIAELFVKLVDNTSNPRNYKNYADTTQGGTAGGATEWHDSDTYAIGRVVRVDLQLYDYPCYVQLKSTDKDGQAQEWGDIIEYLAPSFVSLPISAIAIRIRSRDQSSHQARYGIQVWRNG